MKKVITKSVVVFVLLLFPGILGRNCAASGMFADGWTVQNSGTTITLYSVHFASQTRGVAVGGGWDGMLGTYYGVILKTTDGGVKWENISTTLTRATELIKVSFVNSLEGWITPRGIGAHYLLHTTDGGETWQRFDASGGLPDNQVYHQFVTDKRGWIAARGAYNAGLWRTDDGGATWQWKGEGLANWVTSFYFFDQNVGYVVNDWTRLWRTDDGGDSWQELPSLGGSVDSYTQAFASASSQIGWFTTGYGSTLFRTADGYNTRQAVSEVKSSRALFALNANDLWIIGQPAVSQDNCALYRTQNQGLTWQEYDPGTPERLRAIFFVDENHGWAVGENGTIVKYNHTSAAKHWPLYR